MRKSKPDVESSVRKLKTHESSQSSSQRSKTLFFYLSLKTKQKTRRPVNGLRNVWIDSWTSSSRKCEKFPISYLSLFTDLNRAKKNKKK